MRGEETIVVETKIGNSSVQKTNSKNVTNAISAGKVSEKDIFANMLIDCRKEPEAFQREVVRHFLYEEFGDKVQFSENFITKVLEKLR